jgi:hypothetical protein
VTAQEHEAELVVGFDVDEAIQVVELAAVVGFHVVVESVGGEVPVGLGGFAAEPIDGPVAAVVVIQPPGFGGVPVTGQRSAATAKASATASSARSMSPRKRIRVAVQRPTSRR